jgi:FKBP-type peptidyl-prolyl cis-trans isomerase SlpA
VAGSYNRVQSIARGITFVITVQSGSFLTLHYRLAGPDGADVVNTFNDKPATLSLGTGQLAPAIEARLVGLPEGAHESFDLPAGAAFGDRNPDMLQRVKLSLLHELGDADARYELGDVVQFPTPDGQGAYAGVVREVGSDWLLFDFNHPLAGQPVRFEVRVVGVL